MKNYIYTKEWFDKRVKRSIQEAEQIIPLVINEISPKSVIDVGCATGAWLMVLSNHGINNYCGIDGQWVFKEDLLIPRDCFLEHDLSHSMPKPHSKYDLAISIEVAEHLPENMARSFVKYLCSLSDFVLFSAAVPLQGGRGHINEQPQSYWANLFSQNGFDCCDLVRPQIWHNELAGYVHRQNILLYVSQNRKDFKEKHRDWYVDTQKILDVIHPVMYQKHLQKAKDIKVISLLNKRSKMLIRNLLKYFALF